MGIKSPKGGKWSNNTIKSILVNPLYAGIFVIKRYSKVSYKRNDVNKIDRSKWEVVYKFEDEVIEKFLNMQQLDNKIMRTLIKDIKVYESENKEKTIEIDWNFDVNIDNVEYKNVA